MIHDGTRINRAKIPVAARKLPSPHGLPIFNLPRSLSFSAVPDQSYAQSISNSHPSGKMSEDGERSDMSEDEVPQTEPLDSRQVLNNAGGFVYKIDDMARLRRFLILGRCVEFGPWLRRVTVQRA